ncbi:MAG: murein biosynthesis integral membrane protein MurJ [Candidatus Woesearchaeota archaeon]|jgi:putative peptidoglycan lipid II flippase
MSDGKKIVISTSLIMFLTLIGSFLGFIVNLFLANYFGAGKEVDAFVIASIIPTLIYGITNTLLVTCLVVVSIKLEKNLPEEIFHRKLSNILNITLFVVVCLLILLSLFAGPVIHLLGPGFDKETLNLTRNIFLILLVGSIFMTLSGFTTGLLYSKKHFVISAMLKPIISISSIFFLMVFVKNLGIYSIAIGIVIGYSVGFLFQYIMTRSIAFKYKLVFNYKDPIIKEVFILAIPLFISALFFQIQYSIPSIFASFLNQGDIAILNYAFILINFCSLFIGGSIATVLYPSLTKEIINLNKNRVKKLLSYGVRISCFLLIPITGLIILMSKEIISLIYQKGAFGPEQTTAVAITLVAYSIGLFAYSLDLILSKYLYALEKMKTRAIQLFILMIITITLSLILMHFFGYMGLALASAFSYIIVVVGSFILIDKVREAINLKNIGLSLSKIIFSTIIMLGILFLIIPLIKPFFTVNKFGLMLYLTLMSFIGVVLYTVISLILHCREISYIQEIVNKGIRSGKTVLNQKA